MLWTDTSADRVYRAFLNGTSTTTYIGTGIMECAGEKKHLIKLDIAEVSNLEVR